MASLMSLALSSTSRISTRFSIITRRSVQGKIEDCPLARSCLGPDTSAVTVDDSLDDRQAHSRPCIIFGPVQSLKNAEQLAGIFHVEPDPIVFDEIRRARLPALLHSRAAADFDDRRQTLPRVLERVGNQVEPHLLEQRRISLTLG